MGSKKLYIIILLSFSIGFVFNSCNKDDKEPMEFYIPQELLDYFYFHPSSYWVYENTKTGDLDTVIIRERNKIVFDGYWGDKIEEAKIAYYSKYYKTTNKFSVNTLGTSSCLRNNNFSSSSICYTLISAKSKPSNFIGEARYFSYPFVKEWWGNSSLINKSKFIVEDIIDSVEVDSKYYKNVVKVFINSSMHDESNDVIYYWAKNFGIIKKEDITNSEDWILIESKIF